MRTKLFKQAGIFCLALATALSAFGMENQKKTSCSSSKQDNFLNVFSEKKKPNKKTVKYFNKTALILEENNKPLEVAILGESPPPVIVVGKFWLNPKLEGKTFENITELNVLPNDSDVLKEYADLLKKHDYKYMPKDDGIFNSEDVESISNIFKNLKILNIAHWGIPENQVGWCASIKKHLIKRGLEKLCINGQQLGSEGKAWIFENLAKNNKNSKFYVCFLVPSDSTSNQDNVKIPESRLSVASPSFISKKKTEKLAMRNFNNKGMVLGTTTLDMGKSMNQSPLNVSKTDYADQCWSIIEQCKPGETLALPGKFWKMKKFSNVMFINITHFMSTSGNNRIKDSPLDPRCIPDDDGLFTPSDANDIQRLFPNLKLTTNVTLTGWKLDELAFKPWISQQLKEESERSSNQTLTGSNLALTIQKGDENSSVKVLAKSERSKLKKKKRNLDKKLAKEIKEQEKQAIEEQNKKEEEIKKYPSNKESENEN